MNWFTNCFSREIEDDLPNYTIYEKIDIVKTITLKLNEEKFIEIPENGIYTIYIKSIDNKGGSLTCSFNSYDNNSNNLEGNIIITNRAICNVYPKVSKTKNGFLLSAKKDYNLDYVFIINPQLCISYTEEHHEKNNKQINYKDEIMYIIRIIGI